MKYFKCPDCKTFKEKENTIIQVQCPCGAVMEEVDSNHNPLTEAMKICDCHKCENCPMRGVGCFTV